MARSCRNLSGISAGTEETTRRDVMLAVPVCGSLETNQRAAFASRSTAEAGLVD